MKRVVKKLENSKVEVTCEVETATWKEAQEKAFNKLAKDLEVKGFRKGKVPTDIARKHIDQGRIFNEAINSLLQPCFEEVLREEKLSPFARPSVDVTKISDTDLELKYIIILAPEVKLGEYKNLEVKKAAVKVEEKEVQEEIEKLIAQNASLVVTENASKKGDTVVIDFVGSVDGKEFEGGKAENYSLELGSNSFVPGFEDQLVGHKAGEKVDVNVTFPTQYVPELAGKKALFKCTIHEVKEKVLPELNEELIKDLNIPEVKTVEELKAYEKKSLTNQKESKATSEALDSVISKIAEAAKIELADEVVNEEVESMKKNMEKQISERGLTLEQYYSITGQKPEEVEKTMRADAVKNLRAILCLEEIAKQEKIEVTDADVEFEMAKIAEQYKMDIKQVKDILGKDLPRFKSEIKQRRIQEFLINNNIK